MHTDNRTRFRDTLAAQYKDLFATDPEYSYSAARITPEALAQKMTDSLANGSGNKEGKGIRRTCKILGVSYTYSAIATYLGE